MIPVIAIVGRPNVGKSTLYNRITSSRDALVDDKPGVTRDRLYGTFEFDGQRVIIVDTGGVDEADTELQKHINSQVEQVLEECDCVFFMVDGQQGLTHQDMEIAALLRKMDTPKFLVVNKSEGRSGHEMIADFYEIGIAEPVAVSARRGDGLEQLLSKALVRLPADDDNSQQQYHAKVAIIGRPNVGKSTLINALAGESRVIVLDEPGTTRDSISVPIVRNDKSYLFFDTAGVRKKSKISDKLESFSVVKTLQALESCQVAVLVLDVHRGLSDQDVSLAGMIESAGRAIVIAANKWDGLEVRKRNFFRREMARKLSFLPEHDVVYISALHGSGLGELMPKVDRAFDSAFVDMTTGELNRLFRSAVEAQSPPIKGKTPTRLKFAHQGGKNPPRVIIHGNQVDRIPATYSRYLAGCFQKAYRLKGVRVQVEFRKSSNPFSRHNRKR